MRLHADDVRLGSQINTSVCIVGAGAAGITLARELAGAGIDVVLLDGADQPQSCSDNPKGWSSLYAGNQGDLLNCTTTQNLQGDPDGPTWMTHTRKRTLGGSTNCWGATCIPLLSIDFAPPGLPGIPWPLTYSDLLPYYQRALEVIHLGKMEYFDIGYWVGQHYVDPFANDPNLQTVMSQQAQSRYWKFQCVFEDDLRNAQLQIINGGHMVGLYVGGDGNAQAVHVATLQGSQFTVSCRYAVLAAGGVENVRLLFNADPAKFPHGAGNNAAGMLGKFFCVHPVISGAAFVHGNRPTFGGIYKPLPIQQPNDVQVAAWTAVTENAMRQYGIANIRMFLADVGSRTGVNLNWQQVSNPDSTITPIDATDRLGQRRVKVDWQLTAQDFRTASTALDLIEKALVSRNPAWTLQERFDRPEGTCRSDGKGWYPYQGYGSKGIWAADHHMGATRMSASPADGIVDRNCQVHTIGNLFVAGSSVFPQAGFANPTYTITAMAIRLADYLKSQGA